MLALFVVYSAMAFFLVLIAYYWIEGGYSLTEAIREALTEEDDYGL